MYRIILEETEDGRISTTFIGTAIEKYRREYEEFDSAYKIKRIAFSRRDILPGLKPRKERVCRFCGKSSTETTFRRVAHLLPELIGNKHLRSDFECDTCNGFFNKHENDLANFLGISRSIGGIQGKNGIPTFKSTGGTFVIKPGEMPVAGQGKGIIMESYGEHFELNH